MDLSNPMFRSSKLITPVPEEIENVIRQNFPVAKDGMPANFWFSMPKCGSTMLTKVLRQVFAGEKIPSFHFSGVFWEKGITRGSWSNYDLRHHMVDGVAYYGFRSLPPFIAKSPLLKNRKSILLLRDPRDAATSHYFSKLYEHPVPGDGTGPAAEKYLRERAKLAEQEIDAHVIDYVRYYMRGWRGYMESLPLKSGNVKIYRYEDIIYHKLDFFREAFDFLELSVRPELLEEAVAAVDIFPTRERIHSRVRSVKPGNHIEKLKPETIEQLNVLLAEPLKKHGYL